MHDTPAKVLIVGSPHSGKTHSVVDCYLHSLREDPLAKRALVVPNVSYREHMKGLVMRQGGLEALPEREIVTLAEFLYDLAYAHGLLAGRRMSSLEERAVLVMLARDVARDCGIPPPQGTAAAETLHRSLLLLRHAGLFLQWLRRGQGKPLSRAGESVSDFVLRLAFSLFRHMREECQFDGLFGQETAVAALGRDSDDSRLSLPDLVLVDGFYDLNDFEREAVAGIARAARGFVFALPAIPGDGRATNLLDWARRELTLPEQGLNQRSQHMELLSGIAEAKIAPEVELGELLPAFVAGAAQVRSLPTYLAEAEFIADSVLALHRREAAPLDSFLVVLAREEAEFEAALNGEFMRRGIPLVSMARSPQRTLVTDFLSSIIAYLESPDGETAEALVLSSLGYFEPLSSALFRELYRFRGFLNPALVRELLKESDCTRTLALIEELDAFRASFSRNPDWASLSNLLTKLGQEFVGHLQSALADEPTVHPAIAAAQQAAQHVPELLRLDALDEPVVAHSVPEMLALAQEALAHPHALAREQYSGAVYIVDALVARQWQKPYVFVARMDAEHWPGGRPSTLLADALRERLHREGVRLRGYREEYEFSESLFLSAIARSTKRTFVTRARRTIDGKELLASPFLHLLAAARREDEQVGRATLAPAGREHLALASATALRSASTLDTGISPEAGAAVLALLDEQELMRVFAHGGMAEESTAFSYPAVAPLLPASFSPSALTRYRKCPYLYFASWLLGDATGLESLEEGLTPADVGRAVHEALRAAFAVYPKAAELPELFRRNLVRLAGLKKLLSRFELELESELDRWEFPLGRFYQRECERLHTKDLRPVIMEADLSMTLEDSDGQEFTLHGFPDRVDASADGKLCFVYDYKTGRGSSFKSSEGKLARAGVDLAGLCYSLLVARELDLRELPRFAYLLVRENQRLELAAKPTEADTVEDALTSAVARSVSSLRRGDFPRAPHSAVECESCEFYRICRRDRFAESLPNEVEQWFPLKMELRRI